jgi:hypothetical protein
MSRPESSPAYLTRCIEELLDALCEAHGLARAGQFDGRLAETLRFADDLLDIITESTEAIASDPQIADDLDAIRDWVKEISAMFPGSSSTVH